MDPKKLSGPEKAAVFLLSLGEAEASQVFKKLSEQEIKVIAGAMAKFEKVPPEVADAIADEFVSRLENKDSLNMRGDRFMRKVLGSAFEKREADKILRALNSDEDGVPFQWSQDVDASVLKEQLLGEHPQTIAMILAHLPPEKASEILAAMPDDKKGDIAIRIVRLGQVPMDIVKEVDRTLRNELSQMEASASEIGGIDALVDILNNLDRSSEDIVMETIEEEHAEMAGEIREKMFVFEDLIKVDDRGMREILKKVENQQLALAMKTATEEMKQKILGNLSQRAAEMLLEDLEVMGPVRLAEVEEAQQGIIRAAKELESEGTIVLGGKGKEDVLV